MVFIPFQCMHFSLGKLEEEFERKFNSLPQYSPMTFDKKGSAVTKKKKIDMTTGHEELTKVGKGTTKSCFLCPCRHKSTCQQQLPILFISQPNSCTIGVQQYGWPAIQSLLDRDYNSRYTISSFFGYIARHFADNLWQEKMPLKNPCDLASLKILEVYSAFELFCKTPTGMSLVSLMCLLMLSCWNCLDFLYADS